MIHLGIDHHKKYCHVVALKDSGEIVWEGQVNSDREAFQELKSLLPAGEPVQSVLEAGRNWGVLYDALEELELHPKLANPLKVRRIAESFVKTDKIDATVHATLLKAGMTPAVHVPSKEVREQRNLVRQRTWLVRMQTALKNRIHMLLDRHQFVPPVKSDLFGLMGRAWLKTVSLGTPDQWLLEQDLALLDILKAQIRQAERWIDQTLQSHPYFWILQSLPGIGPTLAPLIALEVDTIERFAGVHKFVAYCGLAPSTYSSGGKTFHGKLIPTCNRQLRYAFVEAAWGAVRSSIYFSTFFKRLKYRKGPQIAIGAVARKLCEITYFCLKNKRVYREKIYCFHAGRPGEGLARR